MSFVNSPVHDLLIRIKNAYMARRETVQWVIYSWFKEQILELLKKYRFIKSYETIEEWNKKFLKITLKEVKDANKDIPVVKFFSKPSRRWFVPSKDLKPVAWGRWIWIISTNKWVMASHEAKKQNVGWELIAEIY